MTVSSEVKQLYATLKGIEASLSSLYIRTDDEESARIFKEAMQLVNEVKKDVQSRLGELEREGLQSREA